MTLQCINSLNVDLNALNKRPWLTDYTDVWVAFMYLLGISTQPEILEPSQSNYYL